MPEQHLPLDQIPFFNEQKCHTGDYKQKIPCLATRDLFWGILFYSKAFASTLPFTSIAMILPLSPISPIISVDVCGKRIPSTGL